MAVKSSDRIILNLKNATVPMGAGTSDPSSPAQTYLSDHVLESVLDELGEANYPPPSSTFETKAASRTPVKALPESPKGGLSHLLEQLDTAVGQRFSPEMAPATRSSSVEPTHSRYLLFKVHRWQLAIPLDHVMEVGNIPSTTWVPQLPLWVRGITHIRGEIYTVVDTRGVFDLNSTPVPKEQMILTRTHADDVRTVLVVDRVLGIRTFQEPRDADLKPSLSPNLDPFVRGISQWQGQALIFFDLDQFLHSDKLHPWREIAAASSF